MYEKVISQLENLDKQREQLLAQLNAVIGAEQALKQLLESDTKDSNESNKSDN